MKNEYVYNSSFWDQSFELLYSENNILKVVWILKEDIYFSLLNLNLWFYN